MVEGEFAEDVVLPILFVGDGKFELGYYYCDDIAHLFIYQSSVKFIST